MSEKETGGSAFPMEDPIPGHSNKGMTLRDYFAAKSIPQIQAYMASQGNSIGGDITMAAIADMAYAQADAMMEARKK